MPEVVTQAEKPGLRTGVAERAEKVDEALTVFRDELAADQFTQATGKFREAVNLSRSWPELRTRVVRVGVEQAKGLLPRNWRVAEAVLTETRGLDSDYSVPSELWDKVRTAQRDEVINNAISAVDVTESVVSVEKAKQQLQSFIATYPDDARLKTRMEQLELGVKPSPVTVAAPVPEPEEELVEEEEPEEEEDDDSVGAGGQRVKITVSSTAWEKFKTALTLTATVGMLGMAGTLVWMHFKNPEALRRILPTSKTAVRKYPVRQVVVKAPTVPQKPPLSMAGAEEKAWEIVQFSRKPEDVQLFLSLFPSSPHVAEARAMMEAAEANDWQAVNHSNAKALQAFLQAHPAGVHAKEAQNELAALGKQAPHK